MIKNRIRSCKIDIFKGAEPTTRLLMEGCAGMGTVSSIVEAHGKKLGQSLINNAHRQSRWRSHSHFPKDEMTSGLIP